MKRVDKYYSSDNFVLLQGNSVDVLRQLPAGSIQTCVTSPPYWALRDAASGSTSAPNSSTSQPSVIVKADGGAGGYDRSA